MKKFMVVLTVILILLILPLVMNRYLLRERMKDVDQVKKIVAEVLENEDFRDIVISIKSSSSNVM